MLPLECVPQIIRDHGLTDAHTRPLAGVRRRDDSIRCRRSSPLHAWRWPLVEWTRTGNSIPALAFDLDAPDALEEVRSPLAVDLPEPNLVIWRIASGHAAAVYTLRHRVFTGENARLTPMAALGRASEWLRERLQADPGFVGVLVSNPVHPDYRVDWRRPEASRLRELLDAIPRGWHQPRPAQTAIGRNADLFHALCRFAGADSERDIEREAERLYALVPDVLQPHAFTRSELAGIVRSVLRYRQQWIARGWHQPDFIERQRSRGRAATNQVTAGVASGVARRRATGDRDERILAALAAGLTTYEIAAAEGVNQATVVRIRQRHR